MLSQYPKQNTIFSENVHLWTRLESSDEITFGYANGHFVSKKNGVGKNKANRHQPNRNVQIFRWVRRDTIFCYFQCFFYDLFSKDNAKNIILNIKTLFSNLHLFIIQNKF